MKIRTIGIVGYGAFGKTLLKVLPVAFPKAKIFVYSPNTKIPKRYCSSFEKIAQADLIIPAVPIRSFKDVVAKLATIIRTDSIVMDVCSVKIYPKKVMLDKFPKTVSIIATHPMFGPGAIKETKGKLNGLKLVMEAVRINKTKYETVKSAFKKIGLKIIQMTAREHDRRVAEFQFTAQFIGLLLKDLKIKHTPIDTMSVKKLHDLVRILKSDSISSLENMYRFNSCCDAQFKKIRTSYGRVIASIQNK